MTERPTLTPTDIPTAAEVKAALDKNDQLEQEFATKSPADWYKDDIDLEPNYCEVIEIRSDRHTLFVKHLPTGMYESFSVMTGPRALKNQIKNWVDSIPTK